MRARGGPGRGGTDLDQDKTRDSRGDNEMSSPPWSGAPSHEAYFGNPFSPGPQTTLALSSGSRLQEATGAKTKVRDGHPDETASAWPDRAQLVFNRLKF